MYWQVNTEDASEDYYSFATAYADTAGKATESDEVVVRLVAVAADGTKSTVDAMGLDYADGTFYGGVLGSQISSDRNSTYFFELGVLQADGTMAMFKTSDGMTYSALEAYGAIQAFEASSYDMAVNAAVMTWSPVSEVPEPTGGLLVLIGGAMLLLRRKCRA